MMKRIIVVLLLAAAVNATVFSGNTSQSNPPEEKMKWWMNARFGMFIHWGPSSLTGREISWSRKMPRPGCGRPEWGTLPIELYDNLYYIFNPVNYDAEEIVRIAKAAGMHYIVFTTKHHDGFCNFDASNTEYKITSGHSPFRRDIVKELADACHKHNMKLGFYYSQPDWRHPDYLTDNHDRFIEYYHQHVRDLLTNYGKVDIIWFDGLGLHKGQLDSEELFKEIKALQPGILINNRCGLPADFDTPEQKIGSFQPDRPWESCITIGRQWSWHPQDKVKPLKECIRTLVNCVGGDGNMLFNVGPSPLGEIEPLQVQMLEEMGLWLKLYGESIYTTRGGPYKPWDYGVTTHKGNKIYIHLLNFEKHPIELPPLPAKIENAYLMSGGRPVVKNNADALTIFVDERDRDDIDTIVVLELDRDASTLEYIETMPESIATGCKATASNVHGNHPMYDANKAFDGLQDTRWATDTGTKEAWIEVDLGRRKQISRVIVNEEYGNRTKKFELLGMVDGQWKVITQGGTLGHNKDLRFDPVTTDRLRLELHNASEGPTISEILVIEDTGE